MMARKTITLLIAGLACAVSTRVSAQSVDDLRKLYDAGQYDQVVSSGRNSSDPRVIYVVAQSHQKLSHNDEARRAFEQLAGRSDAWKGVGQSAVALLSSNPGGAEEAAHEAVDRDGGLAEAHFQRGLALSARQDMFGAAAAFKRATEIDGNWAYAHYYAGLAFSKVKRADLTAEHFQTFLKLAPQAPERGEVQSILRTLSK
jgi:tetratricopeptide (TPR) repeat protein